MSIKYDCTGTEYNWRQEASMEPKATFDHVKDSGERRDFDTGSRRDVRTGKGRYDLLNPIVTQRLAKHYENGAVKYGDHNWELGQPMMSYLDSCKRHLDKFQEGHRDEDHLAAAMWNIASMIFTEEMVARGILPSNLNDMPDYLTKEGFDRTVGKMTREFNERKKAEDSKKEMSPVMYWNSTPAQTKEWDQEVHP